MAQDIELLGATYPDVPAVQLPKSGGGSALFCDVTDTTATAEDVAEGKYFYTAAGTRTQGTASGGGGGGIVITDTVDPVHGGTIREITAADLSSDTVTAAVLVHGYKAHNRTGQQVTGTLTGTMIPEGYGYYGGFLLPQIPEVEGYPYVWIRKNGTTDEYDAVYGTGPWYSSTTATLDTWRLTFANQSSALSRIYSCPQTGGTTWTAGTSSANNYATSGDRKVIWSSHDIHISSATGTLLMNGSDAILPTL